MNEEIMKAITLLKKNNYVIKKWTPNMESDADECEAMEAEGLSKDCCGCSCSVCLIQ